MKRPAEADSDPSTSDDKKMKKIKPEEDLEEVERSMSVLMDENLLYEVLKHADARTLATATCVNKRWHAAAQDERLWELICTRHFGSGSHQLRSVVLALGGFRRLHSLYLLPLSKPSSYSSSSASTWPCLPQPLPPAGKSAASAPKTPRWGKDEVQLSLSLLSIRYYEKMNFGNRGKRL